MVPDGFDQAGRDHPDEQRRHGVDQVIGEWARGDGQRYRMDGIHEGYPLHRRRTRTRHPVREGCDGDKRQPEHEAGRRLRRQGQVTPHAVGKDADAEHGAEPGQQAPQIAFAAPLEQPAPP